MKTASRLIFWFAGLASKQYIVARYGKGFYTDYRVNAGRRFKELLPQIEDIGDSIFRLNYYFVPVYFAWFDALRYRLDEKEAMELIWQINECMLGIFPRWMLRILAKTAYLGIFRKKAPVAEARGKAGELHPMDWRVEYVDMDQSSFGINIFECAFIKQAKRFGYMGMFPMICRMDYLFSHYMDTTFIRTKTLGDGDDCCNCVYSYPGKCEWSPAKGFAERK